MAGKKKAPRAQASDDSGPERDGDDAEEPKRKVGAAAKRKALSERAVVPAAKRRKNSLDATCGRCGANSSKVQFHMVAGSDGKSQVPSTSCLRCYVPFAKCWSFDYNWTELCAKCKNDPKLAADYEQTCAIEEGAAKDFPTQSVSGRTISGYRVAHNLALVQQKDFATVFGSKLPANAIDLRYAKMPDHNGTPSKGVLIQHPMLPWTDVQVFHEVRTEVVSEHMAASSCLRSGQGESSYKAERKAMFSKMPVGLRIMSKVPTLEAIKKQFRAAELAQGTTVGGDDNEDDDAEGVESGESESEGGDALFEVGDGAADEGGEDKGQPEGDDSDEEGSLGKASFVWIPSGGP